MGVERAVTRWYARQQSIQYEIAALQTRLEQVQTSNEPQVSAERAATEQQLASAKKRLQELGPCPRPAMG